jgi:transposase
MGARDDASDKRLWTDEEKRSICFQTTAPGVSVAQVARRYAMNANMIFKWLRDPRYTPEAGSGAPAIAADVGGFLPVEIIDRPRYDGAPRAIEPVPAAGTIEIDVAGGHRLRIVVGYDPEALARLIRGLSR